MNKHGNGTNKSRVGRIRKQAMIRMGRVKGTVTQAAVNVSRKVVERIPDDSKRGFHDGRQLGHRAVEAIPYAAGAGVGFGFGVSEKLVEVAAAPVRALAAIGCGLGVWAVQVIQHDSWFHEDRIETEVA